MIGRVPLALLERKSPSCRKNERFLAACPRGNSADPAREIFFLHTLHERRGLLGASRLLTVWSIPFSPLGYFLVVMVQAV